MPGTYLVRVWVVNVGVMCIQNVYAENSACPVSSRDTY